MENILRIWLTGGTPGLAINGIAYAALQGQLCEVGTMQTEWQGLGIPLIYHNTSFYGAGEIDSLM